MFVRSIGPYRNLVKSVSKLFIRSPLVFYKVQLIFNVVKKKVLVFMSNLACEIWKGSNK